MMFTVSTSNASALLTVFKRTISSPLSKVLDLAYHAPHYNLERLVSIRNPMHTNT